MAPRTTRRALPLLFALLVCGCGAAASSSSVEVTRANPVPNTCGGCQPTMANTCMRIIGAAVDRPGVTVARLCDPWCCQLTQTELGDVGYVHSVHNESWSTCPGSTDEQLDDTDYEHALGAVEGSVVEGPELLVPRATVVLSGVDRTVAETTNEIGRYRIDDLVPGDYTLTVYYGEVVFKQQCIHVEPGEVAELHVNLDVKVRTDKFFIVE